MTAEKVQDGDTEVPIPSILWQDSAYKEHVLKEKPYGVKVKEIYRINQGGLGHAFDEILITKSDEESKASLSKKSGKKWYHLYNGDDFVGEGYFFGCERLDSYLSSSQIESTFYCNTPLAPQKKIRYQSFTKQGTNSTKLHESYLVNERGDPTHKLSQFDQPSSDLIKRIESPDLAIFGGLSIAQKAPKL